MTHDDAAPPCVACGRPVEGDQAPLMDKPMHTCCYEIAVAMTWDPANQHVRVEDLREMIREAALAERNAKEAFADTGIFVLDRLTGHSDCKFAYLKAGVIRFAYKARQYTLTLAEDVRER